MRAASPRRPPEPALVTFSPSGAPPIPSETRSRGRGLRSARCGGRGRSSAPARRRLTPEGPPGGGTCPRLAAGTAELTGFKNSPTFPRVPAHVEILNARSLPCSSLTPHFQSLARGPRSDARFRTTVWTKPGSGGGQNRIPSH